MVIQSCFILCIIEMKDKARDLVTKKIRQASPVLLLSLVWLDCAIRGFDSFIRMGTASFFTIMWCGLFSAFSMIGMTKFIVMSVRISGHTIAYVFFPVFNN